MVQVLKIQINCFHLEILSVSSLQSIFSFHFLEIFCGRKSQKTDILDECFDLKSIRFIWYYNFNIFILNL